MLPAKNNRIATALLFALFSSAAVSAEQPPEKILTIGEHLKAIGKLERKGELAEVEAKAREYEFALTQIKTKQKLLDEQIEADEANKQKSSSNKPNVKNEREMPISNGQAGVPTTMPRLPMLGRSMSKGLGAMELLAVRADSETEFFAKIKIGSDSKWVQETDVIQGWTVISIQGDEVRLFSSDLNQSKTLSK